MSDNISFPVRNTNTSKSKLQELNDLRMLVKKERFKNIQSNILLDIITESVTPAYGVKQELGVKIKDIILRGELLSEIQTKSRNVSITQLLSNFNDVELSFDESNILQTALEQRFREKHNEIMKELNELTDNDCPDLTEILKRIKFDTEKEKNDLVSLQKELLEQQKHYVQYLSNLGEKIQQLIDLKTGKAVDAAEKSALKVSLHAEKMDLRCRIMNHQLQVAIFKELPITMDAYRKAFNILKMQQTELAKEIEQVEREEENYKIISRNEEFQEILKDYKQHVHNCEKNLWILKHLLQNKDSA